MRHAAIATCLLAAACLQAAPAAAWTDDFHADVASQSARLMPASLRTVLAQNEARLREGATAPHASAGTEGQYLHAHGSHGSLDEEVLRQTQRVLDLLSQHASFSIVAYEMGVLSHLVSLAESPIHVAADDDREAEWAADFESFASTRMPKYRTVFDGYVSPSLERDDVRGFVRSIAERSRRWYPVLATVYRGEDGRIVRSSGWDERHPAFGVASLAHARSISDTAKLWLYVWIRSGGDTTRLPFPMTRAPQVGTQRPRPAGGR